MPLTAPVLDDRRYADIVRDAKSLIPRYTPEWTDHNPSDPGITLIELYAWMIDMLLYRVNQVPERNYIKFLQLLGVERRPAAPARAELTFTLARADLDHVIIPSGTRVGVGGASAGGAPIVFETDEALIALGASLVALQSFDGVGHRVETEANATPGQSFLAFGPAARSGSTLMLGFDSPITMTSQQMHLAVSIGETGVRPEGRHCDLDVDGTPPPARLMWEFWDGATWQPLGVDRDDTRALTRNGHVYVRGPGAAAKRAQLGQVERPLYWIRVRLVAGEYELPPRLASVLTNTVRATQATTLRHEVLGGSDGRPNQTVRLSATPVLVRERADTVRDASGRSFQITSLRLEIDEGQGFFPWREVEDFYASGPDDADFMLNRATGECTFGDGRHGRIPLANTASPVANIVAREYRVGGGGSGNAGAGAITDLQSSIAGAQGVTNLTAATGGTDEEPIAETKLRAAREVKAKNRAVTAEDFELLAQGTPGARVRRAKALPLRHPAFGEIPIPGVVTVIVVPDTPDPAPRPNDTTLRLVCAHLNTHRLLTTEVHVVPPTYRKVRIQAEVIVRADGDLAEVKRGVEAALSTYLHPLTGGDDGTGWPFGVDIFFSKIYRTILAVPGVDRVRDGELFIWLDDEQQIFCRDVPIGTGALTYSVAHDIRVAYPGSV